MSATAAKSSSRTDLGLEEGGENGGLPSVWCLCEDCLRELSPPADAETLFVVLASMYRIYRLGLLLASCCLLCLSQSCMIHVFFVKNQVSWIQPRITATLNVSSSCGFVIPAWTSALRTPGSTLLRHSCRVG